MTDNREERDDLVTLIEDEGNEHQFAVIEVLEVDTKKYAIMMPVVPAEESDDEIEIQGEDAFIFRIEETEDGQTLVEVDNEEEWNQVAEEWETRLDVEDDEEDEPF